MADLIVSSAVDTFMQSVDATDMLSALGINLIGDVVGTTDTQTITNKYINYESNIVDRLPQELLVAVSPDESTALTTGTSKYTLFLPADMTVTAVRATVATAPTGSGIIVDINKNGTSILSTKITIDATTKTSALASVPPEISDGTLADTDEITIDIDQVGATIAGSGLKVLFIGYRDLGGPTGGSSSSSGVTPSLSV